MAPSTEKKSGGLKIGKALKSAALLPIRVTTSRKNSSGGASGRGGSLNPQPGEQAIVVLRLQVIGCMNLLAKDRGGTSDPFVVVSILNNKQKTPVENKTLNPTYAGKDATFDFPIYLSLADKLGVLELVVWDKDMLSKEYLGEVALPLDDWFLERDGVTPRAYEWDSDSNKPFSLDLLSSKSNTVATGSVQLKLGFVPPHAGAPLVDWEALYRELSKRSRPSLVSAPATEGVGTIRSNGGARDFEDDGGLSSDAESDNDGDSDAEDDDEFADALETATPFTPATAIPKEAVKSDVTLTNTAGTATPTGVSTPPTGISSRLAGGLIPKKLFPSRKGSSKSVASTISATGTSSVLPTPSSEVPPENASSLSSTPVTPGPPGTPAELGKKTGGKKGGKKSGKHGGYELMAEGQNDIVGIVMLEIQSAEDLPRLKNMTRTGWDMDPFVVISFGKKVFRTRVIRHSRNPVWDEKLLFHVRRYETNFNVHLSILDWDKLSANDHIGDASFGVGELIEGNKGCQPDERGLYSGTGEGEMREFKLKLETGKGEAWEVKHTPTISLRAKYQPYAALRQRFWRQYLAQYDTDDTMTLSQLELTSMLDSLGSTLTHPTINSFFTRFGKSPKDGELTFDEAIQCLETELGRPDSEKRLVGEDTEESVSATPLIGAVDSRGRDVNLEEMDFSGPGRVERRETSDGDGIPAPEVKMGAPAQQPLVEVVREGGETTASPEDSDNGEGKPKKKGKLRFNRRKGTASSKKDADRLSAPGSQNDSSSDSGSGGNGNGAAPADSVERVINVKSCPLCHRPRMNSKAEVDIITHLAICASQDWSAVDKIVVGNFVTASQAQRKWYTKVLGKVSSGDYRLGANSANIIVQDRRTGMLEEEKMQVYVRLGIRLLYKGAGGQMEGGRAKRLLKSLSIKQGVKYDDPASAKEIPAFIAFHRLNVDEILDPLPSFKTFNEFFYRKLKPTARPVDAPEDPARLVSAADSRFMAFSTVSEATQIWIKGRDFTVAKLLGEKYGKEAHKYEGGALAIFRLAPQDYHRFHVPVDGVIGEMSDIAGEYYTVNPQAIRTALDVYGDNVRKIVPIDSPVFGRVMMVCVGAMMVGSIKTTVEVGQTVKKGDEFGYFAFGGSTIVTVFEKDVGVQWDEDLLINGKASLETLVRVGMGIGRAGRSASA